MPNLQTKSHKKLTRAKKLLIKFINKIVQMNFTLKNLSEIYDIFKSKASAEILRKFSA